MSENVANKSVFSIAKLVALLPVLPPQKMWEHFCDVALHVWPFSMMFLSFWRPKSIICKIALPSSIFRSFSQNVHRSFSTLGADENSASAIRNLWQMVLKAIWILARWRLAASGLCCNHSSTQCSWHTTLSRWPQCHSFYENCKGCHWHLLPIFYEV